MTGRLPMLALLAVLAATALAGSAPGSSSAPSAPGAEAQRPSGRVTLAGVREHLVAFQRIADRNGGNRFAGTAGYDQSASYVAQRMRAADYRVRLQRFSFPFVSDRSPPVLRALGDPGWSFRAGRDYVTLAYSGSGRVEAPVAAVDLVVPSQGANTSTSGCERSDFATFPAGSIALVQRGTCVFRDKVTNAIDAGAVAVVVFNEGGEGRRDAFSGTLGTPQVRVPVLAASFAVGDALRNGVRSGPTGVRVSLETDVIAETRRTTNVIAESRTGSAASVVLVGAHLDSVEAGPGINDNGSGSAVVLETAEQLAEVRPRNRLRFVWWGAEELGLLGSRHYVQQLSAAERRRIALYLNFDMVGSPNYAVFVYDGNGTAGRDAPPAGSAPIERAFVRYFSARRLPYRETALGGSSDHAPFATAGIPVGGIFTGADGRKPAAHAQAFGGQADAPYDPCYHRACDTLANVSGTALTRVGNAALAVVSAFARDASAVTRAR